MPKIPHAVGTAIGAALGGGIGYKSQKDFNEKNKGRNLKDAGGKQRATPTAAAISGALLGGYLGHNTSKNNVMMNHMLGKQKLKDARTVGAVAGGALGGAAGNVSAKKQNEKADKNKRDHYVSRTGSTLAGLAGGANLGHNLGGLTAVMKASKGWKRSSNHSEHDYTGHHSSGSSGHRDAPPRRERTNQSGPPSWAAKATTKADAKKAYRAEAMKFHPDRHGGSEEKMKKVNTEWDEFQNSHHFKKMSHYLPSFIEELNDISEE